MYRRIEEHAYEWKCRIEFIYRLYSVLFLCVFHCMCTIILCHSYVFAIALDGARYQVQSIILRVNKYREGKSMHADEIERVRDKDRIGDCLHLACSFHTLLLSLKAHARFLRNFHSFV